MKLSSERTVVQNPLIRYATEAGWTYMSPDDALRLRRGETSPNSQTIMHDCSSSDR